MERSEEGGILSEDMGSDGARGLSLTSGFRNVVNPYCEGERFIHSFIEMDGREIFDFATRTVPKSVEALIEKAGISVEDIDIVVPHQANARIVQIVARKLKIPMEKFYLNMEEYGNTSSASIPIALNEMDNKGLIKKGDNVLITGFGAGLTWGSMLIKF